MRCSAQVNSSVHIHTCRVHHTFYEYVESRRIIPGIGCGGAGADDVGPASKVGGLVAVDACTIDAKVNNRCQTSDGFNPILSCLT